MFFRFLCHLVEFCVVFFFFSLWEISLLVLSKKIEGLRMEEQEDRWKEWHRWPEETNQEVWHIVGGGGSGGVWGGWGCWVRIESQVKTEEMMRLMTVVNTFSLYVTSEVKTAKSMLSKLFFCRWHRLLHHWGKHTRSKKERHYCRNLVTEYGEAQINTLMQTNTIPFE